MKESQMFESMGGYINLAGQCYNDQLCFSYNTSTEISRSVSMYYDI